MKKNNYIIRNYIKKNVKQEYLPVKLIKKINQDIFTNTKYEYRTKNNFLRCISTIYFKQIHEHYGLEGYVPTGSAYWRTIFGGDYHEKVIKPLIEMGILESHEFGFRSYPNLNAAQGKESGSVGVRYRINPELMDEDEFWTIDYIVKNNAVVITAEETITNRDEEMQYVPIPQTNLFISIDKQKVSIIP